MRQTDKTIEAMKQALERVDRAIDEPNITMSDGKALKEIFRQLHLIKDAIHAAIAEAAMQRLTEVQQEMEPTAEKSSEVQPVAWLIEAYDIFEKCTLQRLVFDKPKNMQGVKITAYYIAPPKREPLTEEEMWELIGALADTRLAGPLEKLIRATERAHGIGVEE